MPDAFPLRIAIVGDYNPNARSHPATDAALCHAAERLGIPIAPRWIYTDSIRNSDDPIIRPCHAILCAPASPYRSMDGALAAIRLARQQRIPFLGTCGGFQHALIEYFRNVLGVRDAEHEETSPAAPTQVIARLACVIRGAERPVRFAPESLLARIYDASEAIEEYLCSFGLNPEYLSTLRNSSLRVAAIDDNGECRAVELRDHPFFVATLFLPQHRSTSENPHPILLEFIRAASAYAGQLVGRP